MKSIIYIADPEIISIEVKECNEALIDIRTSNGLAYGPPPECELTKDCYTRIRKTVFDKLLKAQDELPNGWRFRLYEGFRSIEVQQFLFNQEFERVKIVNPNDPYELLFRKTTRLISPVMNLDGTQNIPAHNTGAAIDVEVITSTGELVDMGMEVKNWNSVHPDLCLTECDLLSETARRNRILLLVVMQNQGFINYPTEWWHFSYGDRYWAFHQPKKLAIYGSADKL